MRRHQASDGGCLTVGFLLPIATGALGDGQAARWGQLREMAVLAEAVGFDAVAVPDHLIFRSSPPGNTPAVVVREGRSRGVWEGWTILSAVAAATRRVWIGPLVACTSFRNPALLAKMAATLDEVSGGRLVLGLGAGWHEPEYHAFGFPFDRRVSRFEEALQIIVPLLREGRVDFQGRYYQARDCELLPRGPQPRGPRISIGAQGPRMLRLAARHADRYDADFHLRADTVAARFAALDRACAEVGRDPRTIERSAGVRVALVDPAGDVGPSESQVGPARGGIAEYELGGVRIPAPQLTRDEMVDLVRAFQATGVEHLTCSVVDPPGVRGIERLARVIETIKA